MMQALLEEGLPWPYLDFSWVEEHNHHLIGIDLANEMSFSSKDHFVVLIT